MISRTTTKELFALSAKELAQTRSLNRISVKEIAQNCGMTTTTFYQYFQDTYSLYEFILLNLIDPYFEEYQRDHDLMHLITQILSAVDSNRSFHLNAIHNTYGPNEFLLSANKTFYKKFTEVLLCPASAPDEDLRFFAYFYALSFSSACTDFVLNDERIDPGRLARKLFEAMPQPLKRLHE